MRKREETKKIKVGKISIGHSNRIIIQSMCNTKTFDVTKTVKQILSLEKVGCELVRVSVPDEKSALAINKIKEKISIPLVADIHFDYKLALMSIDRGIDKIRINPGNIGDYENIKKVVTACKKKRIPIRVGVNSGSLSKKILNKYNGIVTAKGLYESAKENIRLLEKYDFYDTVVSIKSSDVLMAIDAYKLFASKYDYPLHIGITEAGTVKSGNIKSSVGLSILLYEGIGDTMRVSLTGDPTQEIWTAKKILENLNLRGGGFDIVSCPTCARTNIDIISIADIVENKLNDYKYEDMLKKSKRKKYKVAVMGCAVNGPGEAKEADIGIAGGLGEAVLFKKGVIIRKIKEKNIVTELLKEINRDLNEK